MVDIDFYQTNKKLEEQLTELGNGGNVNLKLRPQIDASELEGWDAGEGIATVFSSTYSNKDGTIALNFTPIIANPKTGEYIGYLTPDELQEYAEGVIAGTQTDYLNLQIGSEFTGKNAIRLAGLAAEEIHKLQEDYYLFDEDNIIDIKALKEKIIHARKVAFAESYDESTIADSVKSFAEQLDKVRDAKSKGFIKNLTRK